MNYLVSIITPCYNSIEFIEQTIDSVLEQSYLNWEMIIVDDSSTDKSQDIILKKSKEDKRIKPIFLKQNVGVAKARNIAIKKSKGRFLAFLDSDDIWNNKKIEKQIDFMRNKNIAFSFTSYQPINKRGEKKYPIVYAPEKINYYGYLKNTIIGCLTVMLDKKLVGDFTLPNIRSSQDMSLWLMIMKRDITAYGMSEVLAKYRVSSNSNSSNKIRAAFDVWMVYRKLEKLSFIYSLYCWFSYIYNALVKRI